MTEFTRAKTKWSQSVGVNNQYVADGFISYKTEPDFSRAEHVATIFKDAGAKINFIHGDSACPHAEGSKEAEIWITQFLGERLQAAPFLFCVVSETSLQSEWVKLEFFMGMTNSKSITILWFNGSDPSRIYVPQPRWLVSLLPLAPVYLLDLREDDADETLKAIAHHIPDWPKEHRKTLIRRMFFSIPLLIIAVTPYIVREASGIMHWFPCGAWALVCVVGTILFAPHIRLFPKAAERYTNVARLTLGFSPVRYGFAFAVLLTPLYLKLNLSGLIAGAVAPVAVALLVGLVRVPSYKLYRTLIERAIERCLTNR